MNFYTKEYFERIENSAMYRPKLKRLLDYTLKYKPKKVLDVGCGHGFLVKRLLEIGIDAIGVDFSEFAGKEIPNNFIKTEARKLPFKDKEFDVVISSDFFEHLEEKDIDQVYFEMKRVGINIVAQIGTKGKEPSHLTVKPLSWWEKKLPNCEIIKTYSITKCQQN